MEIIAYIGATLAILGGIATWFATRPKDHDDENEAKKPA
jgi:hypothetical protein